MDEMGMTADVEVSDNSNSRDFKAVLQENHLSKKFCEICDLDDDHINLV